MEILGFGIFAFLLLIGFLWLLPIIIIAVSRKTRGTEQLAWILAVIFISWFAWIFYMLLAPISRRWSDERHHALPVYQTIISGIGVRMREPTPSFAINISSINLLFRSNYT